MSIRFVPIKGNAKVIGVLTGLGSLTRRGLRQGMFKAGRGLVGRASTDILHKPKSGRTYIRIDRAGRRRRHVASAPGETHANMTGAARRSLGFKLRGVRSLEFGYGVGTGKDAPKYVKFLEFGTRKMAPRPSLQNTIKKEQGNMVQHFENEIGKKFKWSRGFR